MSTMWRTVVILFCCFSLFDYGNSQLLSELTRPKTSGYDLNPNPRLLQGFSRPRNSVSSTSLNGPPPIPQPPSPPMEVQQGGGGFIPQEPHFGPPPIPDNMGPPQIPNMPSSGGFSQLPAAPGQQSSSGIDNSQNAFGNPQMGVPSARNDAPSSFNPYPNYMNMMASNIQNRLAGYPAPPSQEQQRQQQQTVQAQQHPGVYTLGGLPYTPDGISRSEVPGGFQPPIKPPDTPEYSYDWSFNNGPKLFGGAKEDLVRINNLLPATAAPTTRPTTRVPLRAMLLTKCIPNDIPDAVGICTPRSAAGPRRPRCGEKVQALSNDCSSEELCCFEMPVMHATEAPTIQEKSIDGIAASCISPLAPNTPGLCIPKIQRARRCIGLVASTSPNCDSDEVCCFNTGSFALHDFVGQVVDTTATSKLAPLPVAMISVVSDISVPARSMCAPDIRPSLQGFCSKKANRPRECKGMLASTSAFCQKDEVCCFIMADTNSRAISATGGSNSNQLGYYDVTAAPPTSALTTRTTQSTTTPASNNNGGQNGATNTTSYSLQFIPTELCVPVTNSNVFDGSCVAASNIQNVCAGLQIASSSNCPASSYCCYANRASINQPTPSGCIPDNNPSVSNGVCTQANNLASSCSGISISPSRYCAVDAYCCYRNSQSQTSTTSPPNGSTGQPATTQPSTGTTTSTSTGPGSEAPCAPQSNPNGQGIQNGTCVSNSQIRARCQKMQISLSLDCDLNEYCCYTSTGVDVPTPVNGGCIPETNPTVVNGKCVSVTQLSTVCRGIQISTSQNCQDPTMFCCFNSGAGTNQNNQTGYTYDTTAQTSMTTQPTPLSSITTVMTTFNTSGIPRSTSPSTYTTPATTVTTRSSSTPSVVYNYRQMVINGGGYGVGMPTMANRTCSPQSNRQIQNGFCVSSMQISEQCRGIQISPSLQCLGDEYCCYQSPPPLDVRPGGACIPSANPRILNGVCVDPDQLSTTCRGVQMSGSRNCRVDQFCCYNTNDQYAWGWGSNTGLTQRVIRPPGSCKPAGVSEESGTSGICVDLADVMVACKAWQVARSEECRPMQYCCFSQDTDAMSPKNGNAVPLSAQLGNRDVIRLAQAAQQATSMNDRYVGLSNYYSAGQPLIPVPATTPRSTSTTSRPTTTRPRSTATPATSPTTDPMPSRSCRPMSNQAVSNGICVANTAISQACSGIQVSPSLSCYASELCCFTSPPEDATTVSPYPTSCRPDTEPGVIGLCVSLSTSPNGCNGRRISSSKDCATRQYCCFSMDESTTRSSTTSTSTMMTELTSPEEDQTMPTPPLPSNPADDPTYCPHPEGCCTADYADQNSNGRGMCVDASRVAAVCRGIEIATSRNCDAGQLCCYSHGNQSVLVPPGPETTSLSPPPSPSSVTTPPTTQSIRTTAATTYPATTQTTRTQPTTPTTTSTTSSTTPSTGTTMTTRTVSTATTRKPSSNRACLPGRSSFGSSLAASPGKCTADWQISTACQGLQLSGSLDCDVGEYCCYVPVLITTQRPNQEGFCVPDYAPAFFDGRCVDSSQLTSQCAGVDISPSANCGVYQMCCYNISSSSTLGTTGTLSYYTSAPSTSTQTVPPVTTPTTTTTTQPTTFTVEITAASYYQPAGTATDNPTENGCVPLTSPNVRGFCVTLDNMASQCAGIQASNSRGCPYGSMCCYRQMTEVAREGEGASNVGELSITSARGPELRADARVVPRSASAITIPYSWPRFLR